MNAREGQPGYFLQVIAYEDYRITHRGHHRKKQSLPVSGLRRISVSPAKPRCSETSISNITFRMIIKSRSSLYMKNNPANHFGIEKHMFILFADIRGFTKFSESSLPYDVIFMYLNLTVVHDAPINTAIPTTFNQ